MIICNICKSNNIKKLINWENYTIQKCSNCKLIFAEPLPSDEELSSFYQGFLFKKPDETKIPNLIKNRKKELRKLFDFSDQIRFAKDTTFLDYGGGTGIVYKTASDLGMDSYYNDLDEQAKKFTQDRYGLTSDRIIEDITQSDTKFDYIFSDNVIEHVKDPQQFIMDLVKNLKKDGKLVIKTPLASNTELFFNPLITIKGYLFKAMKYNSLKKSITAYLIRFWHCDPPRHLYSFSKNSFENLMSNLGVENLEYNINYYHIPWFTNTFSKIFFTRNKNLVGFDSIFKKLLLLIIIPIETIFQVIKQLLLKLKILSPGGIILTIVNRN